MHISCIVFAPFVRLISIFSHIAYLSMLFSMLWICTSVLDISFLKMTEEDVYSLSTEKFTKKICIKDTVRKRFVNTENDNSLKNELFLWCTALEIACCHFLTD